MNLGQLIGELRARAEAAEAGGEEVASTPPLPAKPQGKRQRQVMELLEGGATVDTEYVSAAIGISRTHAAVLLLAMATKAMISRHGKANAYCYTKHGIAPNP